MFPLYIPWKHQKTGSFLASKVHIPTNNYLKDGNFRRYEFLRYLSVLADHSKIKAGEIFILEFILENTFCFFISN